MQGGRRYNIPLHQLKQGENKGQLRDGIDYLIFLVSAILALRKMHALFTGHHYLKKLHVWLCRHRIQSGIGLETPLRKHQHLVFTCFDYRKIV